MFRKAYRTSIFKEINDEKFVLFEQWCFDTALFDITYGKNIFFCYIDTQTLRSRYQKFDKAYKILCKNN